MGDPGYSETDAILPLTGVLQSNNIFVGATAIKIPAGPNKQSRRGVLLFNNDVSRDAFWGGSDVTLANGITLPKQTGFFIEIGSHVDLFIVSTAAGVDLRFIELV